MRNLTKIGITNGITAVMTFGVTIFLKSDYQKQDNDIIDNNTANTTVTLIEFVGEFYNNSEVYTNYQENTKDFFKAKVIDKYLVGERVIGKVEVIDTVISTNIKKGDIIEVIEPYIYYYEMEISDSLYVPMYVDNEYYLNVKQSDIYKGKYVPICHLYGAIKVDSEYNTLTLNDFLELSPETKMSNIKYNIEVESNRISEIGSMLDVDVNGFSEKYTEAKNTIEEYINSLIN